MYEDVKENVTEDQDVIGDITESVTIIEALVNQDLIAIYL